MNLLHHTVEVERGFLMNGHDVDTRFSSRVDIALRLDDHEVSVERFVAYLFNGFDDGKSEGDVGHEHAVHDIEVEPVGLTAVDHFEIRFQVAKIS